MRRKFSYYFLLILLLTAFTSLSAQNYTINRSVFGTGGMLGAQSGGYTMSGIGAQTAIDNIAGTYNGQNAIIYQGFWVPLVYDTTGIDDPTLSQNDKLKNFPNPFSSSTKIRYELPGTSYVTIKVYDIVGHLVKVVLNSVIQDGGQQEIAWDARDESGMDLTAGSYMYELTVTPAQMAGNPGFDSYSLRNVMVIVR